MNETDLHFFIDSTVNYFEEVTSEKASAGIPYIKDEEPVVLEYTGIIGISGKRNRRIRKSVKPSGPNPAPGAQGRRIRQPSTMWASSEISKMSCARSKGESGHWWMEGKPENP